MDLSSGAPHRRHAIEVKDKDVKRKQSTSTKKADLMDVRVIQRHLVYAVGLAGDVCDDRVLKGPEFFGKDGNIKKISVTWNNNTCSTRQASAAAYVLYHTEEEAWNCIQAIDGAVWSGKQVRACYGTTKYCHSYLRKATCNNPDCSYLHAPAPDDDIVTKDEMHPVTGRKDILHLVHPGGTPRCRTKKAMTRVMSNPIDVPPASAAAASPDAPSPTPSKASPAWAIPAPPCQEALVTEVPDSIRDSSSSEDSPHCIVTAGPGSTAWPSLSEVSGNTADHSVSHPDRRVLVNRRRPSTKDIVAGTATVASSRDTIPSACMLPLPSTSHSTPRHVTPRQLPVSSFENPEDALSTVTSVENFSGRLHDVAPGQANPSSLSPRPTSPISMSEPPTAQLEVGSSDILAVASASGDTSLPTTRDGSQSGLTGVGLSALDLLPADLEDALDEKTNAPSKGSSSDSESPQTEAIDHVTKSLMSFHLESQLPSVHRSSNRKQSRFSFVNENVTPAKPVSPHDMGRLSAAPAFTPGAAVHGSLDADMRSLPQEKDPAGTTVSNKDPNQLAFSSHWGSMHDVYTNCAPNTSQDHHAPPHDNLLQTISAQLQALMTQGSHASQGSRLIDVSPPIPHSPLPGASVLPMAVSPQPSKLLQGNATPTPSNMQLLQALLLQQDMSSRGDHVQSVGRGIRSTAVSAPSQPSGLANKRVYGGASPSPASASHLHNLHYQNKLLLQSYMPQRNRDRNPLSTVSHVQHSIPAASVPAYSAQRNVYYSQVPQLGSIATDGQQIQALQSMPPYCVDGSYLSGRYGSYSDGLGDVYGEMVSSGGHIGAPRHTNSGWPMASPGVQWE